MGRSGFARFWGLCIQQERRGAGGSLGGGGGEDVLLGEGVERGGAGQARIRESTLYIDFYAGHAVVRSVLRICVWGLVERRRRRD
jgi:hypothetical protein